MLLHMALLLLELIKLQQELQGASAKTSSKG